MKRRLPVALVLAALVILAGCTGGPGGTATDGSNPADGTTPNGGVTAGETGTVHFYVSDEPNAINDFEHLNVTISAVGLHQVEGGANATATPPPANATATPENGTATPGENVDGEQANEERNDGEADAKWVEYEVNRTVDLTNLVGANATKLDVLQAPAGTYDKVFVYVEEIHAVLDSGEEVNVKLPSEKLHINKQFAVGNGQEVEFVFDIAIHKAGKSGKYILKPVVSQSGTGDDVEIEDTDERDDEGDGRDGDDGDERGDDAANESDDVGNLQAEFVGPVKPGKEASVKVTGENGPVAGASVEVDGETVGTTGADGRVTFDVAPDAEKIEVKVRKGEAEVELEREFEKGGNDQGDGALARIPE